MMTAFCPSCRFAVPLDGELLANVIVKGTDPAYDISYKLVQCPGCKGPILTKHEAEWEIDGFVEGEPQRLYPTLSFKTNENVPPVVGELLQESVLCFEAGAYNAAVIMTRKTLEGFCKMKGGNGNLNKAIAALRDSGVINEDIYQWADALRLTGNKATHSLDKTFTMEEAKEILDFMFAMVDYTYLFKEKFEQFKVRHSR